MSWACGGPFQTGRLFRSLIPSGIVQISPSGRRFFPPLRWSAGFARLSVVRTALHAASIAYRPRCADGPRRAPAPTPGRCRRTAIVRSPRHDRPNRLTPGAAAKEHGSLTAALPERTPGRTGRSTALGMGRVAR